VIIKPASHRDLQDHEGQCEHKDRNEIGYEVCSAAVLPEHGRESPDIAEPDSGANSGKNKTEV
jgi:hypothetical protein